MDAIAIVLLIAGLAVGGGVSGIVCFKQGEKHRQRVAEAAIGSAEEEAKRLLGDAKKEADQKKK